MFKRGTTQLFTSFHNGFNRSRHFLRDLTPGCNSHRLYLPICSNHRLSQKGINSLLRPFLVIYIIKLSSIYSIDFFFSSSYNLFRRTTKFLTMRKNNGFFFNFFTCHQLRQKTHCYSSNVIKRLYNSGKLWTTHKC